MPIFGFLVYRIQMWGKYQQGVCQVVAYFFYNRERLALSKHNVNFSFALLN